MEDAREVSWPCQPHFLWAVPTLEDSRMFELLGFLEVSDSKSLNLQVGSPHAEKEAQAYSSLSFLF